MRNLASLFLTVTVAFVIAACGSSDAQTITGNVGVHNHSGTSTGGTLGLSTSLTSTKACAAGYNRVSPNLCLILDGTGQGTNGTYGVCQTITNPAADARAIIIKSNIIVFSANAAGALRETDLIGWDDAACASNIEYSGPVQVFEQAATAAGSTLYRQHIVFVLRPASVGANVSVRVDVISGTSAGTPAHKIIGYYD